MPIVINELELEIAPEQQSDPDGPETTPAGASEQEDEDLRHRQLVAERRRRLEID